MNKQKLTETVKDMIGKDKIILAMDESKPTINKRLKSAGIPQTEKNISRWREVIATADLKGVGAAILYEGSIFQPIQGKPLYRVLEDKGIVVGLKVDEGKKPLISPYDENMTLGLDTLHDKIEKYGKAIRFAKWRSEFKISKDTPTYKAIKANAYGLAAYASICQKYGIVPIVEPEILIKGNHSIDKSYDIACNVLNVVFSKLDELDVYLPGIILKASMVTSGDNNAHDKAEDVASATIEAFLDAVPCDIGGIAFLSGGLDDHDAVIYLNAINQDDEPWRLTASYGRALLGKALETWHGLDKNIKASQKKITERTAACSLASIGKLDKNFRYKR